MDSHWTCSREENTVLLIQTTKRLVRHVRIKRTREKIDQRDRVKPSVKHFSSKNKANCLDEFRRGDHGQAGVLKQNDESQRSMFKSLYKWDHFGENKRKRGIKQKANNENQHYHPFSALNNRKSLIDSLLYYHFTCPNLEKMNKLRGRKLSLHGQGSKS